ncbi:MAG: ATP phosphoribosyltransferase [Alphaproteobacteria bacterium]|nr:MAG: ATP phosphoribosyltransferase [Alphaproteobacteria bacterium]
MNQDILTIAIPKGRIYKELQPILERCDIVPEPAFFQESARQLVFNTNHPKVRFIRVRSFDVATFVTFGAAELGVVGADVLEEFHYENIYAPLDLGIGLCRLSVAEPKDMATHDDPSRWTHIRVATKYPNLTKAYFAQRGVQAECVKLNGAMELAPLLGLSERIVDLVSTGTTLAANNLVEVEILMRVSSRLIVNRLAYKTRHHEIAAMIERFKEAVREGGL